MYLSLVPPSFFMTSSSEYPLAIRLSVIVLDVAPINRWSVIYPSFLSQKNGIKQTEMNGLTTA